MTRPGLTPARVFEVAAEIVDRHGVSVLTLAAVAQRLDVKTPSLYSHVDGIESLRRAVALRAVADLGEACRTAAMGKAGGDALAAIAVAYRDTALAHPGSYALTQIARPGDPEWQAAADRVLQPILAALAGVGVKGTAAIHATRMMRSALHGFVLLETGDGFGMNVSVENSFRHLVQSIVRAVSSGVTGT
jgi:AcrR family transcriptional regulator